MIPTGYNVAEVLPLASSEKANSYPLIPHPRVGPFLSASRDDVAAKCFQAF
jgi:hypothetical protein